METIRESQCERNEIVWMNAYGTTLGFPKELLDKLTGGNAIVDNASIWWAKLSNAYSKSFDFPTGFPTEFIYYASPTGRIMTWLKDVYGDACLSGISLCSMSIVKAPADEEYILDIDNCMTLCSPKVEKKVSIPPKVEKKLEKEL